MAVEVGGGGLGSIYVGDKLVAGGGGGGSLQNPFGDTITVTWTEAESPNNFNPVWSDGATGATAGDIRFDEWFGYSGVRLNSSGKVTQRITQEGSGGYGKLDITKLGTLTSGDNVMIEFPVRGIKMTKSGSNITLSMTKQPNKSGYQYYAHTRNSTIQPLLYLGAYEGSRISNVLKSLSGQGLASSSSADGVGNISMSDGTTGIRVCARANDSGNGSGEHGYEGITWYQRSYINALYMMKYGNPNSQSVIGNGYVTSLTHATTGGTNSQKSATYGTTEDRVTQVKVFGLEDWYGNYNDILDGCYTTSASGFRTSTTGTLTNTSWSSSIFDTYVSTGSSGSLITSISGSNTGMFAASSKTSGSVKYYCDTFILSRDSVLVAGGGRQDATTGGVFYIGTLSPSTAYENHAARLAYL